MAALTSEEKQLKVKALKDSFTILKEHSTGLTNEAKLTNIVDLANSSAESSSFTTKISIASLKQPKSRELKKLKKEIDVFRNEFKQRKNIVNDKSKKEINRLNVIVDKNTETIAKLLHNEMEQENRIEQLENTINKLREERNLMYMRLSKTT